MSKVDIGVGEEFPLHESQDEGRREDGCEGRRGWHRHGRGYDRGGDHHHHVHLAALAMLLALKAFRHRGGRRDREDRHA